MFKILAYVVSPYLSPLQRLLLIDLGTDFLVWFPFLCAKLSLCSFCTLTLGNINNKTFPAQTHKYTCRPAVVCTLSPSAQEQKSPWCMHIELRPLLNSVPQTPVLCFHPFKFHLLCNTSGEQPWGQPHYMHPCWTDGRHNLSPFQSSW